MIECFFFVEPDVDNKEDGTIRAVCVECRMGEPQKFPGAWFHNGHVGPWTISCYNCSKVIHQHEEGKSET